MKNLQIHKRRNKYKLTKKDMVKCEGLFPFIKRQFIPWYHQQQAEAFKKFTDSGLI